MHEYEERLNAKINTEARPPISTEKSEAEGLRNNQSEECSPTQQVVSSGLKRLRSDTSSSDEESNLIDVSMIHTGMIKLIMKSNWQFSNYSCFLYM